jgi:tetratricopeptide (TPR) repeat protein
LKSASARCNNQSDMRVVLQAPLLAVALLLCPAKLFADQFSRGPESEVLKQEPKQTRRLLESALRLEKEGKTAAAIAAYGELLEKVPNHWYGLRHRGQLLVQAGQLEAASRDLSAVVLAHPEDGAAWASYGDSMRGLKRDRDAAGSYLKAIQNGFNNAAVNRRRGDMLASTGENDAALDSYSYAIKLRLDDPETYFARGMLLMKMKRERDAIDDFTRAIDFNPDYADAYFGRGRAWGELSQFANAVRDLDVFLRLKPGDAQALGYRGAAFDTLGRVEEALADYAGALKADPTNSRVFLARAELYSRLGRHAEALPDRDRAIALEPLNAYFWMARGGTQLALGNAEQAISDRTRAVELAPASALMWYSRATTYSALEQPEKALNDAIEALRHNSGFEVARQLIEEIEAARAKGPDRLKLATVLSASAPESPKIQPGTPVKGLTTSSENIRRTAGTQPTEKTQQAAAVSAPVVRSTQQPAVAAPAPSARHEIATLPNPTPPSQAPDILKPELLPPATAPVQVAVPPKAVEHAGTAPKPSAHQLYMAGRALLERDEFAAASAKLTQAAALDPGNPQVWNALGYSRMRQKNYKAALEALDKAIALNPRYENAYENRSAVKRLLGDGSGSARDRIQAELLAKHR